MMMKNNVMFLGCSHLSGAYSKDDIIIGPQSYAWHLWNLYGNNDRYVTFSNPAQGIIKYASIVEYLDRNDLLKSFTHCVIQLTQEPRTVFMSEHEQQFYDNISEFLHSEKMFVDGSEIQTNPSFISLSENTRYVYEKYQHHFFETHGFFNADYRTKFLKVTETITESLKRSNTARALLPISYSYIKNVLAKYDIKIAAFDWWGKDKDQVLSLSNVMGNEYLFNMGESVKSIMEHNGYWNREEQSNLSHMNQEQSYQVSEILKEYMDNVKFFE
jgi:hypothetical protein